MATVVYDIRKSTGKRVSFLCDRGFQIVGVLRSINPDNTDLGSSAFYDYDIAILDDVQLLSAGGVVIEEHERFTYPLRSLQSIVELDEQIVERSKECITPLDKIYDVALEVPELMPVARYLEAQEAASPEEAQDWQGWDAGLSKLEQKIDKKQGDLKEWVSLLPKRKQMEKMANGGISSVLRGYQHFIENIMDSGVSSDIKDIFQQMYKILTSWLATANSRSPF
jgi:hypothetical protein